MNQVEDRLFLDDGWNKSFDVWFKGYSTECRLEASIDQILSGYRPVGKWCVIKDGTIITPSLRGFPIFQRDTEFTNIQLAGFDLVPYTIEEHIPESLLTIEEAAYYIGDILVENTKNLYRFNDIPNMNVVCSAGLDTLTAWAVLDQVTKDYTVDIHVPRDTDVTFLEKMGTIRDYPSDLIDKTGEDYWGYTHASFRNYLNWNATGYYAEAFQYRDGIAINAIASYYGKKVDELAQESDYLYWFLKRDNVIENFKNTVHSFETEDQLKDFLWTTVWVDHQMWHLDKNMQFSPFFDIRIPKIMSRLNMDDIRENCVTGKTQRLIIQRFKPDLLPLLADYKNEKDVWANFRDNFHWSQVDPKVRLSLR